MGDNDAPSRPSSLPCSALLCSLHFSLASSLACARATTTAKKQGTAEAQTGKIGRITGM